MTSPCLSTVRYDAEAIPVYALDRRMVDGLATHLERRCVLSLSITEGQIFATVGEVSLGGAITAHRIT